MSYGVPSTYNVRMLDDRHNILDLFIIVKKFKYQNYNNITE